MTQIIVNNGNWDEARAKLKADLDAQNAKFQAQLDAVFAPPPAEKPRAAAAKAPPQTEPAKKSDQPILMRSRLRI